MLDRRKFSALGLAALLSLGAMPALAQEKFKVVTTFTIIADIARNVAGDAADVESITRPGAEIHNFQPGPRDVGKAQGADLVLWNGLNLEQWFEQFFENVKDVPQVVLTDGVEPMGIAEGPYSGRPNPHAWMSADQRSGLCREHPQGAGGARSGKRGDLRCERGSLLRQDQGTRCATAGPARTDSGRSNAGW
jgi:ABC-type Zn2+ transport system substrate-binding protein/surface adhesin